MQTYGHVDEAAARHQQLDAAAGASLTTTGDCNAVLLNARVADVTVTFASPGDAEAPGAGNGLVIKSAAQPLFVPLPPGTVIDTTASAGGLLDVFQLS